MTHYFLGSCMGVLCVPRYIHHLLCQKIDGGYSSGAISGFRGFDTNICTFLHGALQQQQQRSINHDAMMHLCCFPTKKQNKKAQCTEKKQTWNYLYPCFYLQDFLFLL